MLNIEHLFQILLNKETQPTWYVCKIVNYDDSTGLYTVSPFGMGNVITNVLEEDLEDISNTRPDPVVENGIIKNTWEELSKISASGDYTGLNIGDIIPITLNGQLGMGGTGNYQGQYTDYTIYASILDFDHNAELEGYGISFGFAIEPETLNNIILINGIYAGSGTNPYQGQKATNMNHWGVVSSNVATTYNYGGWAGCDLRYDVLGSTDVAPNTYGQVIASGRTGYDPTPTCTTNPVPNTLMSCLPLALRKVMKPMNKYTDNGPTTSGGQSDVTKSVDYLVLPTCTEIGISSNFQNSYEKNFQKVYPWYTNNTTVKVRPNNLGTGAYWTRSKDIQTSGNVNFIFINSSGSVSVISSSRSYGISPIFLI